MSNEPSTNDYLADILAELRAIRKLLERQHYAERGYAVFRYDDNTRVTEWLSHEEALEQQRSWAAESGVRYLVRSAEEEVERKQRER